MSRRATRTRVTTRSAGGSVALGAGVSGDGRAVPIGGSVSRGDGVGTTAADGRGDVDGPGSAPTGTA